MRNGRTPDTIHLVIRKGISLWTRKIVEDDYAFISVLKCQECGEILSIDSGVITVELTQTGDSKYPGLKQINHKYCNKCFQTYVQPAIELGISLK